MPCLIISISLQVEVIVGHMTGSMALVADAFHMLSDIVALVIAYISIGKKIVGYRTWNIITLITMNQGNTVLCQLFDFCHFKYLILKSVTFFYWRNFSSGFDFCSWWINRVIGGLKLNHFFSFLVVSPKKWNKNTYGFARAEVLGALSNAVFLVALCFSILVEALKVRTCLT